MSDVVLSLKDVRITNQHNGEELVHGVSFDLEPVGLSGSSASPAAGRP